eukprot:764717-Hanusia_phi.AAC.8
MVSAAFYQTTDERSSGSQHKSDELPEDEDSDFDKFCRCDRACPRMLGFEARQRSNHDFIL